MSKILGVKFARPKFLLIGYSISNIDLTNKSFLHKILIFFSGPISNIIIAFIFLNLKINFNVKLEIIYTNLIIGFLNLLPILPLDGGNILKVLLEDKITFDKAFKICCFISKVSLVIITLLYSIAILYLKNIWIFVAIIYLWIIFLREKRDIEIYIKLSSIINSTIGDVKKI